MAPAGTKRPGPLGCTETSRPTRRQKRYRSARHLCYEARLMHFGYFRLMRLLVIACGIATTAPGSVLRAVPRPSCDQLLEMASDPVVRQDWAKNLRGREDQFWVYIDKLLRYSLHNPLQPIPHYFIGNFPSAYTLEKAALNARLAQLHFGEFDSPALRAQLKGQPSPGVVVVVHQDADQQTSTARWLKRKEFSDLPRLILFSEDFPLRSAALRKQGTLLTYSVAGENRAVLNTTQLHFVGGNLGSCLSHALQDSVGSALTHHDTVTVHLHLPHIYDGSPLLGRAQRGEPLGPSEWQSLAELAVYSDFDEYSLDWTKPVRVPAALPIFKFRRHMGGTLNLILHQ